MSKKEGEVMDEKQLSVLAMAGAVLVLFEKNKYCANQIDAVLELVAERTNHHKKIEPIIFSDHKGRVKEIRAFQAELENKYLGGLLGQAAIQNL